MTSEQQHQALMAVTRALTDNEMAAILARSNGWPGMDGAGVADVLEHTVSYDEFLDRTEPFYEALPADFPGGPGVIYALHALILLREPLTVAAVLELLQRAGLAARPAGEEAVMDWTGTDRMISARGKADTYLVFGDEREVRLTRHRSVPYVNRAFEAARNVIVFPMGRGPGRPAGEPELTALMAAARSYAERYEAGESLEGYPHWQHAPTGPTRRSWGLGVLDALHTIDTEGL
jgi:hypothetical protein